MVFQEMQHLTPEQHLLLQASMMTWALREQGKKVDSPLGEETITQLLLLWLKSLYPSKGISILAFDKNREGKLGADWAWAFQSANGDHVMPMLVQAKILNSQDTDYDEIKRKIGKSGVRQIDRLISEAENLQWPAIYAFYNHLDDPSRIPSTCKTIRTLSAAMPTAWGVSVADAYRVRAKLNDQSFDTHCHHSFPLHCLLCSTGSGSRPDDGSGSAGLALTALRRIRGSLEGEQGISRDSLEGPDVLPLPDVPFTELPSMFVDAQRVLDTPHSDERDAQIVDLSDRYPDIAGIVVIRDAD
jgi:hypothetical protein